MPAYTLEGWALTMLAVLVGVLLANLLLGLRR